jgi:hypothetical protein
MKKTYLALALLITGLLLVGNAYGEDDIYYCADIDKNGFLFDEKSGSYKPSLFKQQKFKLKLNMDSNSVEIKGHPTASMNLKYICNVPYSVEPDLLSCSFRVSQIIIDFSSGRFVSSFMSGYINGDGDSLNVSYGKCDKF